MIRSFFSHLLKAVVPVLTVGVSSFAAVMIHTGAPVSQQSELTASEVATTSDSTLLVSLNPDGDVDGLTIRASDQSPVPGLTITFLLDGDPRGTVVTNDGGQFVMSGLKPGQYSVAVTGAGIATSFDVSVVARPETVPASLDPTELVPQEILTLVIQDETEEPDEEQTEEDDPLPPLILPPAPSTPLGVYGGAAPGLDGGTLLLGGAIGGGIYAISDRDRGRASPARP